MAVVSSVGLSVQGNRMVAMYDLLFSPVEKLFLRPLRRRLLRKAAGPQILEVGFGSGRNLPYYLAGVEVTGVDCNAKRLKRSEARHSNNRVLRYTMDCQQLRFNDGRFDQVIAAFALGRSAQPEVVLAEWGRVLKPRGHIYLMELSLPDNAFWAIILRMFAPLLSVMGLRLQADMADRIAAAGMKLCNDESHWGGVVHIYECSRS